MKELAELAENLLRNKPMKEYCDKNRFEMYALGVTDGYNKANEWYKVSEKLPEMDELVYLWNNIDDFPIVACRHIFMGKKEWVWDCKWGSGYTVSQSVAKDYLWKEIIPPNIKEE